MDNKTEIYQITVSKDILMMGYVIKSKNGKITVIDGGFSGNPVHKGFIFNLLKEICNTDKPIIEAWFLTHIHEDHTSEFARILFNHQDDVTINNIYFNFPKRKWLEKISDTDVQWHNFDLLEEAFDTYYNTDKYLDSHTGVQIGDRITVDDITFDILYTMTGNETNINDTSIVFRMTADNQTIMFLGDLYKIQGNTLAKMYGDKLKSDIVQMAHHGQNGVDFNVYELIKPSLCLWPTPDWLWDNIHGIHKTLEVRSQMTDKLNVKHHIVAGLIGTTCFTLPFEF